MLPFNTLDVRAGQGRWYERRHILLPEEGVKVSAQPLFRYSVQPVYMQQNLTVECTSMIAANPVALVSRRL